MNSAPKLHVYPLQPAWLRPTQVRGNSSRSLAFDGAGSASTAFTDALEEFDTLPDPDSAAGQTLTAAAAVPADTASDVAPAASVAEKALEPDGQAGKAMRPVLTAQRSNAKQRALEWEQRMKVRSTFFLTT